MGKRQTVEKIWVNPRQMGKKILPCYPEMLSLMACFKKNNFNDPPCQQDLKALRDCMAMQAKKPKEVNTINHHLQRLSKG